MHLGNRLYTLAQSGKAIKFLGGKTFLTWVLQGPYTGVWTYRRNQTCYFIPSLYKEVVRGEKGGFRTNVRLHGWWNLHPGNPKRMNTLEAVLYTELHSDWFLQREEEIDRIYDKLHQQSRKFGTNNWTPDPTKGILRLLYGIAHPDLMDEFTHRFSSFYHKITWLVAVHGLIESIGTRKRQRFLVHVLQHGPKVALRRSFPRTHRRLLNEVVQVSDPDVFLNARLLSMAHKSISLDTLNEASSMHSCDEGTLPFLVQLGSKHGKEGLSAYASYVQERSRAVEAGLAVDYPVEHMAAVTTYKKWHDRVARRLADYFEVKHAAEFKLIEQKHRAHWEPWPFQGFRPLLSYSDFKNEHFSMHHCIDSYFTNTAAMYAHVENDGEHATVEFSQRRILQLRGHCNAAPSAGMRSFVSSSLAPYYRDARPDVSCDLEGDIPFDNPFPGAAYMLPYHGAADFGEIPF